MCQEGTITGIDIPANSYLGRYLEANGIELSVSQKEVNKIRELLIHDLFSRNDPAFLFSLNLAMKQLSYHLHPRNEWLRDVFHNHRSKLKFQSYFDVPESRDRLLSRWGLPRGLAGKVYLDGDRGTIVQQILNAKLQENFVIIGEPGVGKTAMLFHVFDTIAQQGNVGVIITPQVDRFHEMSGTRLFFDDLPEVSLLGDSILKKEVRGLVVTAREQDWESLPFDLQRMFTRITVRQFQDDDMVHVCENLLKMVSIQADDGTIALMLEYAGGSPIFIWTLIEQFRKTGSRTITTSYLQSNASSGMTGYLGDILVRLLIIKDHTTSPDTTGRLLTEEGEGPGISLGSGMNYRKGGYHGLAMLYLLATHMERRMSSSLFFNRVAEVISETMSEIVGVEHGVDERNPGLILSVLEIDGDMLRFSHDYWADVVMGKGKMNPFSADIVFIRERLSDSRIFELAKRSALAQSWPIVLARYQTNPSTGRDSFLDYCETILMNFTLNELKSGGVDIEEIRQIAARYSHLPKAEDILGRIERVAPLPTQKIIQITDSVIMKSSIG